MAAAAIYQSMYGDPETGIIPASFNVSHANSDLLTSSGDIYDWLDTS